jgi:hypothetical protein
MADGVFHIAKGKVIGYHDRVANNDPANSALILVLLKDTPEADATLEDYDTLAALLAGANTEADFTNYGTRQAAPKILVDTDITASAPDDTNNWQQVDIPDRTWSAAGGTLDNTLAKLIICYDPDTTTGNDTTLVPLTHHDFTPTTNGNDLVLQIGANGYFRAT